MKTAVWLASNEDVYNDVCCQKVLKLDRPSGYCKRQQKKEADIASCCLKISRLTDKVFLGTLIEVSKSSLPVCICNELRHQKDDQSVDVSQLDSFWEWEMTPICTSSCLNGSVSGPPRACHR